MVRKNLHVDCEFLDLLASLEPEERAGIIPYLNEQACKKIYECVHNALYNKSISKENRRKIRAHLKPDEGCFRSLLKTGLCSKTKQKKLCQVGGKSLGILLDAVIPLLVEASEEKDAEEQPK
jgi:hypothetical protein